MKKTDIYLLTQLRQNSRAALTDLSRKTGQPVSTLHQRLKQHIKGKLLTPRALLNFEKIGFFTRAHILLTVDPAEKDKLFAHLKEHPNVNSLFRINNGWHLIMECVFKNMHGMEDFVEHLETTFHIRQKEVHYILDDLKREGFLTPDTAEMLLG